MTYFRNPASAYFENHFSLSGGLVPSFERALPTVGLDDAVDSFGIAGLDGRVASEGGF